jgi:hypothetical protein
MKGQRGAMPCVICREGVVVRVGLCALCAESYDAQLVANPSTYAVLAWAADRARALAAERPHMLKPRSS